VDQITSDEVDQKYPAFDLEQIVWIDDRTGHDEIYQFNMIMQEQYQLTNSKTPKSDVQIYYNWIAWVEVRDGDMEIYYLNLKDDMPEKRESEIGYFIAGFILIFLAVFIIIYVIKKPKEKSLPSAEEINKISSKEELIRLCKRHGLSPEGNKKRLKRRLVNYIENKQNTNEKA
jgi:hypothetical protein